MVGTHWLTPTTSCDADDIVPNARVRCGELDLVIPTRCGNMGGSDCRDA
jgi:hypothetical protein